MKWSRRELSIDTVMDIFKNNQITLLPCFTFIPKTGVSFYNKYRSIRRLKRWEIQALKLTVWRFRNAQASTCRTQSKSLSPESDKKHWGAPIAALSFAPRAGYCAELR